MRKKETITLLRNFLISDLNEQQFFQKEVGQQQEFISIQDSRKQFEEKIETYFKQIQKPLFDIQESNQWVTSILPVIQQEQFLIEGANHETIFLSIENGRLNSCQPNGKRMIRKSEQSILEMIAIRNQIFKTTPEITSISGLFKIKHFVCHSGIDFIPSGNERLFEFTSTELLPYSSKFFYEVCQEQLGTDTFESQENLDFCKKKLMNKIYVAKE